MSFSANAVNRLDYKGTWYASEEAKKSNKPVTINIGFMDATVNGMACETKMGTERLTIECGNYAPVKATVTASSNIMYVDFGETTTVGCSVSTIAARMSILKQKREDIKCTGPLRYQYWPDPDGEQRTKQELDELLNPNKGKKAW
ncbi:hypothetical protein [Alteromonas lipolytica]|nr:hypothetical protein [Alteromonas lipolytica]GGF84155.1 hypothetical protein GCM10011338_40560 [Alteromonas lipolytica]